MNILLVFTLFATIELGNVLAVSGEEPATRGGWSSSKSTKSTKSTKSSNTKSSKSWWHSSKSSKSWWKSTDHPTLFPTPSPTLYPTVYPTQSPTYCGKAWKSGKSHHRQLEDGAIKIDHPERGQWGGWSSWSSWSWSKSSKSESCHSGSRSWWRGAHRNGYNLFRSNARNGAHGEDRGNRNARDLKQEQEQEQEPVFKPDGTDRDLVQDHDREPKFNADDTKARRRRLNGGKRTRASLD